MEAKDSGEHLSKQLCGNCDASESKFWCLDCDGPLCGECELAHRRVSLTRCHRLRNQPESEAQVPAAPVKYCRLHMSEPLELYCFTCEQFTCKDCQLTAHRSHRFEFVSKAVAAVRRQMQACLQPASARRDTLAKVVQDVEHRLEDIRAHRADQRSSLLKYYCSMVYGLKDKVTKSFNDILQLYRSETEQMEARLKKLKLLQQKHLAMSQTTEQSRKVSDLRTLLDLKRQVDSHVKDFLDPDLSPPSHMSRVTITSSSTVLEIINNSFQVQLSWIPFSVSQRTDPPLPPCPDGILPPSTHPHHPSLHNLKPRGYAPRSSSTHPSTSTSASTQASKSTSRAPPCKNKPPKSTSTSGAPSSLPPACPSIIPISTSSTLLKRLRRPQPTGDKRSSSSSASSFTPFTCSTVSSAAASASSAPTPPVSTQAEQLRFTSAPSHFMFNEVPCSDLNKHQMPPSQPTVPPVAPPQQAHPSQNQQSLVLPPPYRVHPSQNQQPLVLPPPYRADPSQNQHHIVLSQHPPMVPLVPPPQDAPLRQNQKPMVLSRPPIAVPPATLPQQAPPSQNQQMALPGAGAHVLYLTNIYTPPTMLIPNRTQSAWIPIPTELPPCYSSQNPIVAFSMGPQFNPAEEAFLGPLGPAPPTHQTHPVACSLVPLSGSTFLQQTEINQDSLVHGGGVSTRQKHVSESRAGCLREPVSRQVPKPAGDKQSRTEPAEDEPTSTLPEETDSAENEPTSTTADQPDPPPDEPSTTTTVEEDSRLITSTSGDLEFAETPETPNAKEEPPSPAIVRRRTNPDKRQLRLSVVRLPIAPPTPGNPLPSFRLVHGDVESEIYLMEIPESPTNSMLDLDLTEQLDATRSEFNELLDKTGLEFDFMEPLSSPGSDVSVEMLSCAVCVSSEALLVCTACARGFHRDCHIPPMGPDVTPGWICSLCQDLSDPSDPYRSVRLPDPQRRGLSLLDQRRCESLLLFLKVEGCRRLTEFADWVLLEPIAERLRLCLDPPYKTTMGFVSDVWAVFRDTSRDAALEDLQRSFRKKVKEVLRHEKHLADFPLRGAEGDKSGSRPRLSHVRKRLRSILDTEAVKKKKKKKKMKTT